MTQDITKLIESLPAEKQALLFAELQKQKEKKQGPVVQLTPRPRTGDSLPLSFAQQRLWFLDLYEPDSPQYNMPYAFWLEGKLDAAALHTSLNHIVARHEVLRTTFADHDGQPYQVIHAAAPVALPLVDLSSQPSTERERQAQALIAQEAQRPFKLNQGPLVRFTLIRQAEDQHILLLTFHHIISDAWSQDIFMRELATLYAAEVTGKEAALSSLPLQYADYAIWQREYLQGEVLEKQLNYWKEALQNTPVLDLPTDRPRPAMRTYNGAGELLMLPEELTAALKNVGQQHNATLFMVLLSAFQVLLHRYTGQDDVVVGSMIANRRWAEIEGLLGFFANTLAFRGNLAGDPTFAELLAQMRDVTLAVYDHQDLPFEKLVDELRLKRDTSRTPLFQVMLILNNTPRGRGLELPDLQLNMMATDSRTAKFDLTLYLSDTGEGLLAEMEYNTDLFDTTTMQRMLRHYQVLLTGIAANPQQRISQLPLLAAAERLQLLEAWNDTQTRYPQDQTLAALFEKQAAQTPDKVAVRFENQTLTYGELNERANRLAHHLQANGVRAETLVALCMDASPDMLVGLLGILKAGGAYVPLDPNYPQDRLSFMLSDTGLRLLLTHGKQRETSEKLRATLPDGQTQITIVDLDGDRDVLAAQPTSNLAAAAQSHHLAYVIYTSGSTGKPKGVQIPHYAVVNFLTSMAQKPGLTAEDTLVAVTTLSFDIAGLELYLPLLVGAQLVLTSRDVASDGERLLNLLNESGATVMQATPATWRLLLGVGWQGNPQFKILCGGEALPRELANRLIERSGSLWNMYGPTEATIWSATCQLDSKETIVSIGQPIANTQLYVLDRHFQPTPVGVPGELYIAGDGLSRGYLHRFGLTAERFVPNPFAQEPGSRMYRTGDLVRYLPDRQIEFLGRLDHQVKVRGFRIELGEIESVLSRHSGIEQNVVIVREDVPGDRRLVAYAKAKGAEAPKTSDLRQFLKEDLPDYMIPALFVFVDEFPLTPNGKVDRRALPAPDNSRPDLGQAYVAPRTETEQILAEIWSKRLGIEQIGIHDNFFDLGGDSLMVVRIVGDASAAGLTLTTKQFFKHQTIADLAAAAGTIQIQAEQGVVTGEVPPTFAMHKFFELNHPNPHFYTLTFIVKMLQPLGPDLIKEALTALVAHHDSMRLRLIAGDAGWQVVNDGLPEEIDFRVVDLATLTQEEQEARMEEIHNEITTSLDLQAGNLMRSVYFNLEPVQANQIMMMGHYVVADVLSWQIFLEDFDKVCQQLHQGQSINLPPKTTSIQQWTKQIEAYAKSDEIKAEQDYWLAEGRRNYVSLPVDFPGGANTVDSSQGIFMEMTREETDALINLAKAHNTRIHGAMLTGILKAFEAWTGSSSLLFELYVIGRDSPFDDVDLSKTVGWLTFSYPMYLDINGVPSLDEALTTVGKQLTDVPKFGIGHPSLLYIRGDKEIAQEMKTLPEPEMFFNFFGAGDANWELFRPVATTTDHHHDEKATRHRPIAISGYTVRGQLFLYWEYSENLHKQETIQALVDACKASLQALVAEYNAAA